MKTHLLSLVAFAVAVFSEWFSPDVFAQGFPPELDGTMMPYGFTAGDTVVPWGEDYKPVFVEYVARHGARYLSSEKKVSKLEEVLDSALAEGRLTPKGKSFLELLGRVRSATDSRWGALDSLGIAEEKRLGNELMSICPGLLASGKVAAMSTYVPRVVMTMYEFCHQLACRSTHLEVSTSEGRQFNDLLRYFDTDSAYAGYIKNGPWLDAYKEFAGRRVPTRPAADMILEVADAPKLQDMTMDAYGVLQSLRAAGIEADYSEWFTPQEYEACWEVDNLKHYYQRSVSHYSDIAARAAEPLLAAIDKDIEDAFEGRAPGLKAVLRFGHAETLIPLFALMRLPGCYAPDCSPQEVAANWKDWQVSPLGANLMIVALKGPGGERCTAMRLNGKWLKELTIEN